MRFFLMLCFLGGLTVQAQTTENISKKRVKRVKKHVVFLSSDQLEGRRTGTNGEKLAYTYISQQFEKAGLLPGGSTGTYLQPFVVNEKENRNGHNVVGYINNNSAHTIVLGAHYDHLGYGEDNNSMYRDSIRMIHNGADDNASGTAALISLSGWLKKSAPKTYNYLLIAFSGEELGLFGSKYFTDHPTVPLTNISYMINMDMVGRLNPQTRSITVGGYGTSPVWGQLIKTNDPALSIKVDSSGTGPSDHSSFYRKDIPVLFFFTGTHTDYHKPSDDAQLINYNGIVQISEYIKTLITATADMGKLAFTKTREISTGRMSFKVSLGIMPDYTFAGVGVLVEGVSSGKPAEKAGILAGDVILQLGENKTVSVQDYMKALGKFDKGQTVNAIIIRANKEIVLPINF
jgi:Zn-dependent M28 family amino/carboxypeptidase